MPALPLLVKGWLCFGMAGVIELHANSFTGPGSTGGSVRSSWCRASTVGNTALWVKVEPDVAVLTVSLSAP